MDRTVKKKAFNHLCELLMEYRILRYQDLVQGYILYMDSSGIGWSGVLKQEHTNDKGKSKNHPICYVSGQFHGSQLNWAALTKEAYTIYMSIKRLSVYVTDADVTIRSDHLPLKKFLNKQTMNSNFNNWAVELEQFRLHLKWIPGSQNLLADSLIRLIDVIPDAQQPDEPKDHEFGSYCFEELEPAMVFQKISTEVIETQAVTSKGIECLLESWNQLKWKVLSSTMKRDHFRNINHRLVTVNLTSLLTFCVQLQKKTTEEMESS